LYHKNDTMSSMQGLVESIRTYFGDVEVSFTVPDLGLNIVDSAFDFMDSVAGRVDTWFGTAILFNRFLDWINNVCAGRPNTKNSS